MRAETGNMAFAGDWTGVFIRGDDAFAYKMALDQLLSVVAVSDDFASIVSVSTIRGLAHLLGESNESATLGPVQEMKTFEECKL
jgi:hypothetical protein